jgi:DNA-binding CsgD family transcriptional regulator
VKLSRLIDRLYDAGTNPALWPTLLNEIVERIGGTSCHLYRHDLTTNRIKLLYVPPSESGDWDRYASCYVTRKLWSVHSARVCAESRRRDEAPGARDAAHRSEFFNEHICERSGFALGAILFSTDTMFSALVAYRDNEPFEAGSRRTVRTLLPHLRRASCVAHRLKAAEHQAVVFAQVLDRMPYGMLLLDKDGLIVHSNRPADLMIAQKDGLLADQRQLRAASAKETRQIRAQVLASVGGGERFAQVSTGILNVSRHSANRPYELLITPLRDEPSGPFEGTPAYAVVLIGDSEAMGWPTPQTLQRLYELTPREAEVATMIVEGQGVTRAADTLKVSVETVRSHLKQVMRKTGTSRQAELVRLVLSGLARIRLPDLDR